MGGGEPYQELNLKRWVARVAGWLLMITIAVLASDLPTWKFFLLMACAIGLPLSWIIVTVEDHYDREHRR